MPSTRTQSDQTEQVDHDESADEVGERLRDMRRRRRLTLQALSESSGISAGMLSQIERGQCSPSIRTLRRVAGALQVPISWFFADGAGPSSGPSWVLRRSERQVMAFGENASVTKELLTPPGDGVVQSMLMTIVPGGGSTGFRPYTHAGEDSGTVLEGSLFLEVGGVSTVLNVGDSFRYSSEQPHWFRNPGAVTTVVLWSVSPPFW